MLPPRRGYDARACANDVGTAFALQGGRILVAGAALRTANTSNYAFAVAGFALDRIFQTGIEKP